MYEPKATEVTEALKHVKINKPIYRIKKKGNVMTFYLYGGETVEYKFPTRRKKSK